MLGKIISTAPRIQAHLLLTSDPVEVTKHSHGNIKNLRAILGYPTKDVRSRQLVA